jgi:hypothetical protein
MLTKVTLLYERKQVRVTQKHIFDIFDIVDIFLS